MLEVAARHHARVDAEALLFESLPPQADMLAATNAVSGKKRSARLMISLDCCVGGEGEPESVLRV